MGHPRIALGPIRVIFSYSILVATSPPGTSMFNNYLLVTVLLLQEQGYQTSKGLHCRWHFQYKVRLGIEYNAYFVETLSIAPRRYI